MTDTRPRVPLNGKTVNLTQLSEEIGAALVASDTEVVVAEDNAGVTQQQLQTAVDLHVPVTVAPPVVAALQTALTVAEVKAALVAHFQPDGGEQ